MKYLVLVSIFSSHVFAQVQEQYPRVMSCQTPDSKAYIEVFHDQSGLMGAPKNTTGYLVVWSTVMGKDTQKRLVLDVPMKHVKESGTCYLDIKWTSKKYNGTNAISNFHAMVDNCNIMNHAPKGKITQEDVYPDGKIVNAASDLNCQLQ